MSKREKEKENGKTRLGLGLKSLVQLEMMYYMITMLIIRTLAEEMYNK